MELVKIVIAHYKYPNEIEHSKGWRIFRQGFSPLEYEPIADLDLGILKEEEEFLTEMQRKGWLLTGIREEGSHKTTDETRFYYFSNINALLAKR